MRKQLYLAITDHLSLLQAEDGSQLIKHIDLWNENISFISEETFALPAVFIEFGQIGWKSMGMRSQEASVTLRLHIVTSYTRSAARGSTYQSQALEFFDLLDSIHAHIHGWGGNGFGGMVRQGSVTNHNHEDILESVEIYQCRVVDAVAVNRGTPVAVRAELK